MDDIAPSEEEAEYWAVFGITHRGNTHCLAEFPTKAAAKTPAHGLKSVWEPAEPSQATCGKKIIQIGVFTAKNDPTMVDIFASAMTVQSGGAELKRGGTLG